MYTLCRHYLASTADRDDNALLYSQSRNNDGTGTTTNKVLILGISSFDLVRCSSFIVVAGPIVV